MLILAAVVRRKRAMMTPTTFTVEHPFYMALQLKTEDTILTLFKGSVRKLEESKYEHDEL